MKDPSKFHGIMRNVMIGVISLLCVFSIASYESYGYRIDDMVTMNLPHDNLTSSVQLLYCLGLLGSFPIQVIPAIDITEKSKCFNALPSLFGDKYRWVNSIILRSIIVISTGLSAMVIPKFGLFINLTGAFACTALAFVVPVSIFNF
jgi:amino acid permease